MTARCVSTIHWFDCDLTIRCVQPSGHEDLHRDGAYWWDKHHLRAPQVPEKHATTGGTPAGSPRRNKPRPPRRTCTVAACQTVSIAKGLCRTHYGRAYRAAEVARVQQARQERRTAA